MSTNNRKKTSIFKQLWFQVIVGTIIGIVLGLIWPTIGVDMKPLGDAFIKLVRMMIGPIIFVTVVHGIAGISDMRSVGRLALKSLIYFEIVTILALVIGFIVVDFWQPGTGMNINPASIDTSAIQTYIHTAHDQSISAYLLDIIPNTLFSAFTEAHVLQVLFISVLFGAALASIGEKAKPVSLFIESASYALFKIIGYIMYFAPLGAFGAIAFTIGKFGTSSLWSLGSLIIEFMFVCALFTIVVFGAISHWCKISLWALLKYIKDEIVVVAATTSTETVLPRLIEKLKKLGCEESVVGFVVPAGYSFNLDGTCLYLTTAAIFLAQATNTDLTVWQELGLIGVLLLTSKGAAGVAGAAFVVLAATLSTTGTIPVASIALIIGIHRILAEGLTFVNLVGNTIATIVIAKWEGKIDEKVLYSQIGTKAAKRSLML